MRPAHERDDTSPPPAATTPSPARVRLRPSESRTGQADGEARRVLRRLASAHGDDASPLVGTEGGDLDRATTRRIDAARSGGRELDARTRGPLESAFGADLSHVRVHEGQESRRLNTQLQSSAFTVGSDIFFRGRVPTSPNHLLAHETAHVLQDGASARRSPDVIRRYKYRTIVTVAGEFRKGDRDAVSQSPFKMSARRLEVDDIVTVDDSKTTASKGGKQYVRVTDESGFEGWYPIDGIRAHDDWTAEDYVERFGIDEENAQRIIEGRPFSIDEFTTATAIPTNTRYPAAEKLGHLPNRPNESYASVNTTLQGGFNQADEDKLEFESFFGPDTWVLSSVFRNPGLAGFFANEAIIAQARKAGVWADPNAQVDDDAEPPAPPRYLAVRLIENPATKDLLLGLIARRRIRQGVTFAGRPLTQILDTPLGALCARIAQDVGREIQSCTVGGGAEDLQMGFELG